MRRVRRAQRVSELRRPDRCKPAASQSGVRTPSAFLSMRSRACSREPGCARSASRISAENRCVGSQSCRTRGSLRLPSHFAGGGGSFVEHPGISCKRLRHSLSVKPSCCAPTACGGPRQLPATSSCDFKSRGRRGQRCTTPAERHPALQSATSPQRGDGASALQTREKKWSGRHDSNVRLPVPKFVRGPDGGKRGEKNGVRTQR